MPDQESQPTDGNPEETASGELNFEKADFQEAAQSDFVCGVCSQPIADSYFRSGEAVVCSSCRWALEAEAGKPKPGGSSRFAKASLYGLGAAAAGTLIYFLVLWLSGYEVGLISILVGWLVGKAVFAGSGNLGGRKYQVVAVALTYTSICASYAPLIVKEIIENPEIGAEATAQDEGSGPDAIVQLVPEGEESATLTAEDIAQAQPLPEDTDEIEPGAVYALDGGSEESEMNPILGTILLAGFVLGLSLIVPFLAGFENILGLLIIGFGLFEAWKHAGARELAFEGPFAVGG